MFFRLPKNTIKNLHFGPFGGGVPPPPPSPPQYSLCLRFYRKIIIFWFFFFFLWAGGGRTSPMCDQNTVTPHPKFILGGGDTNWCMESERRMRCLFSMHQFVSVFWLGIGDVREGSDEEHSTWSGGWSYSRWSWDTVLDWRRATARAKWTTTSHFLISS